MTATVEWGEYIFQTLDLIEEIKISKLSDSDCKALLRLLLLANQHWKEPAAAPEQPYEEIVELPPAEPAAPVSISAASSEVEKIDTPATPWRDPKWWEWTPERDALLARDYPTGATTLQIRDRLADLPGNVGASMGAISTRAALLGIKRPPQPAGGYTHGKPAAEKNPDAVELGRRGGLKGGAARAANMTPAERSEASRRAADARWTPPKPDGAEVVTSTPPIAPKPAVAVPSAPVSNGAAKPQLADFQQIEQWAAQRGMVFTGDNLDEINARCAKIGRAPFELKHGPAWRA